MPNRKEMVEQMRSPDDENLLNKIMFMKSFLDKEIFYAVIYGT